MPTLTDSQTWSSLTDIFFVYGAYCLWMLLQPLWSRVSGVRWSAAAPYAGTLLLILAHFLGQIPDVLLGAAILSWAALRAVYCLGKATRPSEREAVLFHLAAPLFLVSEMAIATGSQGTRLPWVLTGGLKIAAIAVFCRFAPEGTDLGPMEPPKTWISGIALSVGAVSAVFSLVYDSEIARTMAGMLLMVAGIVAFGPAPATSFPPDGGAVRRRRRKHRTAFGRKTSH
jgi:4-amino-4-deoxy-L-arabinose transferase-like glycosyltransferase